MKKRSKNYSEWTKKNLIKKKWTISEILDIILENKLEKFDSTLNITYFLNLNSKKNEHNLKGFYTLPNSKLKDIKIIIFTKDYKNDVSLSEVFKIGGVDYIEEISSSKKIEADVVIATPEIMNNLKKIASILGPKKIMPSVKQGTVTRDLKSTILEYKKGKKKFITDGSKSIHFVLGSMKDSKTKIEENYQYIFEKINKIRPQSIKGKYIKGIFISTTMGPSFQVLLS